MRNLTLLAALLIGSTLLANTVTQSDAQQAAQAFLLEHRPGVTLQTANVQRAQRAGTTQQGADNAYYYIFNTAGNQGYVIVSGDDRTTQVLGYTDSGSWDSNNVPANMQAWLDGYAQQIDALDEMGITSQVAPATGILRAHKATRNSISPLVTTHWDQATPYWNHCPQFMASTEDTVGELAYTGCVATSMAQIMNYHQWPAQTSQVIPSYSVTYYLGNYQYGTFDTDELPIRAFDWEHMRDSYTGGEDEVYTEAVSWLMLYAGCAAHMQYGTSASSTSDPYIPKAFRDYFDYDAQLVYRSDYDQETWEEMIYQELAAGRPMVYNGRAGSGGGHSFVCDGYEYGDYFHINWGWGGMGDGYFVLSVLNPSAGGIGASTSSEGYNIDQTAIIGIKPGYTGQGDEEHLLTVYNMYSYSKSFDRGDNGAFKLTKRKYIKVTAEDHIDDGTKYKRGIALYDSNGNMVELIASTNYYYSSLSVTDSWPESSSSTTYSFGSGITSGTYKIVPVCQVEGSSEWVPMKESDRYYIAVTFTSSTATFEDHPIDDLTATNFEFTGGEKVGSAEQCHVTVKNNGEDRFSGRLYYYLTNEQIDEYGEYLTVVETEIPAGESKVVTFNFTPQNAGTKTAQLSLYDSSYGGSKIPGTGTVTIAGSNTSAMNLSVDISAVGADEENMVVYDSYIKFKVDITNHSTGEYNKYVLAPLFIVGDDGAEMVTYQNQALTLAAGETRTLYFEFDNLAYGSRYALNIYGKNENDSLKNLVGKGESKIYTIQRGLVTWTADGSRIGSKASGVITIPENAVAANLEDLTITSVTPNSNPNCLYYIGSDESVPAGLENSNVIQGNTAVGDITLKHGYSFLAPFRFTAASISYERVFKQGRHAGQEGGWSTMTLPFAATTVTADGAAIQWMHSKGDNKALWVCNYAAQEETTDEGKLYADYMGSELEANVPYLVAPYDGANGTDMRGKTFVFSATDVTVKPNPVAITSGTWHALVGTMVQQDVENAYFLNAAGSHFVKASEGTVAPFEAYAINVIDSEQTQLQIILDEDAEEAAAGLRGDADDDGDLDLDDLTAIIDYMLNGDETAINKDNADCNVKGGDGSVNLDDVTALIDYLLNNVWGDKQATMQVSKPQLATLAR